jgi:hypothetical protein
LPKNVTLDEIKGKKFDLVINAADHSTLFASAISSTLQAPLKCAQATNFNEAELIIEKAIPFNLINYLNDVVKYLKMIKTN